MKLVKEAWVSTRLLFTVAAALALPAVVVIYLGAPQGASLNQTTYAAVVFAVTAYAPLRMLLEWLKGFLVASTLEIPGAPQPKATAPTVPSWAPAAFITLLLCAWLALASVLVIPVYWLTGLYWALRAFAWGALVFALAAVLMAAFIGGMSSGGFAQLPAKVMRSFRVSADEFVGHIIHPV